MSVVVAGYGLAGAGGDQLGQALSDVEGPAARTLLEAGGFGRSEAFVREMQRRAAHVGGDVEDDVRIGPFVVVGNEGELGAYDVPDHSLAGRNLGELEPGETDARVGTWSANWAAEVFARAPAPHIVCGDVRAVPTTAVSAFSDDDPSGAGGDTSCSRKVRMSRSGRVVTVTSTAPLGVTT